MFQRLLFKMFDCQTFYLCIHLFSVLALHKQIQKDKNQSWKKTYELKSAKFGNGAKEPNKQLD